MARTKNKSETPTTETSARDTSQNASLSSLEEVILRMRFGLCNDNDSDSLERNVSEDLRKKLQFLELKAFEQSGRIKELLSGIEKKGRKI